MAVLFVNCICVCLRVGSDQWVDHGIQQVRLALSFLTSCRSETSMVSSEGTEISLLIRSIIIAWTCVEEGVARKRGHSCSAWRKFESCWPPVCKTRRDCFGAHMVVKAGIFTVVVAVTSSVFTLVSGNFICSAVLQWNVKGSDLCVCLMALTLWASEGCLYGIIFAQCEFFPPLVWCQYIYAPFWIMVGVFLAVDQSIDSTQHFSVFFPSYLLILIFELIWCCSKWKPGWLW